MLSAVRLRCVGALGVAIMLLIVAGRGEAATRTWTGGGSTNHFSEAANWSGIAPVAGDDLVFSVGPLQIVVVNDFPAGTLFHSIALSKDYAIYGNAILLGDGGIVRDATLGIEAALNTPIILAADQTWSMPTPATWLYLRGEVQLNGHTLTLDATGQMYFFTTITGTGAIVKTGSGFAYFDRDNSYAGPTTIENGQIYVASPNALGVSDGTLANGTIVNATSPTTAGTLGLTLTVTGIWFPTSPNSVTLGNEALVLNGGGLNGLGALHAQSAILTGPVTLGSDADITATDGPVTLAGPVSGPGVLTVTGRVILGSTGNTVNTSVTVNGADSILELTNGCDTTYGGLFTGNGTIRISNNCGATFTGVSAQYAGSLAVAHGLVVVADAATLPARVNVNGAFSSFAVLGSGRTGSIDASAGGELWLQRHGVSSGQSGSLSLGPGAKVLAADGATNVVGTLHVHGGVAITNAQLDMNLATGFTSAIGTRYTLIDNDDTDPVIGTFADLPEGAKFRTGNLAFEISYVGGDGNDIVVTTVPPTRDYLLSEGATSDFFTTDLLLANPNNVLATATIDFLKDDGTASTFIQPLPALSHKLIRVNDLPGMRGATFSTVVHSDHFLPLAVDRTMSWDQRGYGAHSEHAVEGASTTWYFAEGSQGFFHTYLMLANPQATANSATVQYLREGEAPLTRTYALAPTSRLTVDAAADPELVNRSFGMVVTFVKAGSAERAMYFGETPLFSGGHDSAGVNAPATTWYLAEGATGPFFETFLLLANPGDFDATVTLTYLTPGGSPILAVKTVPAHARVTVNLETESPLLTNAAVSTQVVSTQPILVERSQYWPDPAPNWYEAHNSFGVTTLDTRWGFAEGRVGDAAGATAAQTYIMMMNPGQTPAVVTITFLRDEGALSVTRIITVPARSRFNVTVGPGTPVPELSNETFGALITSDQPIAVEHAVYWDANGQTWAAGTDATAVRLPQQP